MIANARMYAVTPEADEAWTALFRHAATASGLPLEVVDHPFPKPVAELWTRPDLLCAFMCGWPWVRGGARHQPVAAPLPVDAEGPRYWSDLVVRLPDALDRDLLPPSLGQGGAGDGSDRAAGNARVPLHPPPAPPLQGGGKRHVADMEGRRVGYTLLDSQSGFSALRHHLRRHPVRFGAIVGPLTTPRRSIEAVAEGRADVAPIDSFAHVLLRRHLPGLTAQVRVLARTAPTPIPMLVASPDADPALVARLRAALLAIDDPALLEPLCISGFTEPLPRADYARMEQDAREAERDGIHDLTPFLRPAAA